MSLHPVRADGCYIWCDFFGEDTSKQIRQSIADIGNKTAIAKIVESMTLQIHLAWHVTRYGHIQAWYSGMIRNNYLRTFSFSMTLIYISKRFLKIVLQTSQNVFFKEKPNLTL